MINWTEFDSILSIIGSLLCEIFYRMEQFIDSICVNKGKSVWHFYYEPNPLPLKLPNDYRIYYEIDGNKIPIEHMNIHFSHCNLTNDSGCIIDGLPENKLNPNDWILCWFFNWQGNLIFSAQGMVCVWWQIIVRNRRINLQIIERESRKRGWSRDEKYWPQLDVYWVCVKWLRTNTRATFYWSDAILLGTQIKVHLTHCNFKHVKWEGTKESADCCRRLTIQFAWVQRTHKSKKKFIRHFTAHFNSHRHT